MEAQITRHGDVTVVFLRGELDFESSESFRRYLLNRVSHHKVVFHLQELQFVGSSGITLFVDSLTDFFHKNSQTKFCSVSSEFKRVFATSPLANSELFDSVQMAVGSFSDPTIEGFRLRGSGVFQDETFLDEPVSSEIDPSIDFDQDPNT